MKTAYLWILGLLFSLSAQAAVRQANIGVDPNALEPDPKLFFLIGFGLLAVGLVANRKYRN
jgi:hypothetical protein